MPAITHTGDLLAEWKIVDSLDKQGLFKSALEKVEAIQRQAKATNNGAQVIKALIFRGKYMTMLEEDGLTKAIKTLEGELATTAQPEKSVLESLLGELYATYLQNQSWQIRQRTPLAEGEGGDILTWSAAQLERRALQLYGLSVENEGILRATQADYLRDVTTPGTNDTVTAPLRPALFDFLAHRALDHLANERSYLTEPAYKFYLDKAEALAAADVFARAKFESRDSTSNKWLAINLFQKLTAAHLSDGDPSALIDLELRRLQFAVENAVLDNKKDLYREALEALHKKYGNHASDGEIVARLADLWTGLDDENPNSTGENYKRALRECESVQARFPGTYGAGLCAQKVIGLRASNLNIETERTYLPNKPMLARLTFKNLSKAWVKVVNLSADPDVFAQIQWEKRVEFLNTLDIVQQGERSIADPGDFRQHATEIALDALPAGSWCVLVSDNAAFSAQSGSVAYAPFTASNLAPVSFREVGSTRFVVAHRESGVPLAGVKADFYTYTYRYDINRNERRYIGSATSDANGAVRPTLPMNEGITACFSLDSDSIWSGGLSNFEPYRQGPRRTVQFFTDRTIYRPGQTVYFKGILLDRSPDNMPSIVPNQSVTVRFFDVNNQEKGVLNLKTNEFGTINGAFATPTGLLTGQMHLEIEGVEGGAWFSVEEYKRPKFEVTFKPVEGNIRLNETVTVRGEAKNYAGAVVDGAQVRYRVVRQARFPFWDWGWRWSRPFPWRTEVMEITNGTATTGADGTFEVKFEALPDRSIPKKENPFFDYTVYADVTDITGETRSGEQQLSAGYVSLQVDWSLGSDVELDSLRHISIKTTNTAGQKQVANGDITLQRLVEPRNLFSKRYWGMPDVWTMTEADFRKKFPDYAWKNDEDPEKWGREDYMLPFAFRSDGETKVDLNAGKVQPGYYLAILKTKDASGENIEIKRIVRVWDKSKQRTRFSDPEMVLEKSAYQPGETARLWLGSKAGEANFYVAVERKEHLENPRWLKVAGADKVEIPLTESDRGGLNVHYFSVKNNRIYGPAATYVAIPWDNKDLKITFETFRDKLAPGQNEEWRLKISGPKKEKVAAEMVAAMYDASLDQFLPHAWAGIEFPTNYQNVNWTVDAGFGSQSGEIRREVSDAMPNFRGRSYRTLNWFGFPMWGRGAPGGGMYRMKAMRQQDTAAPSMAAPALEGAANDAVVVEEKMLEMQVAVGVLKKEDSEGAKNGKTNAAPPVGLRKNLQETVFFLPELRTDANGDVLVKFKMNEALTRWKFLAFAHTKDLKNALATREVVTQKELMVLANPPRFLREGDEIEFTAKVSNLSQEPIAGTATLNLLDALSLDPVEADFGLARDKRVANFSVQPGQSAPVSWRLNVPVGKTNALTWQIFADGKSFRDGEESTLPVVSNRMLVTETMPISVRGNQTKSFVFENLKNKNSASMVSHRYTLEFSSNPAWYAVQALPYLMEYPHECSEQIFSRFYANTLAASVANKYPNIRRVYDKWRSTGSDAMKSNLTKNQELKSALLEETPWVLDAQNEEQQKQNIALLFDLNRMADERARALATLAERQAPNGGWAWFPGGREDWFITQHILSGMAHLQKLGALDFQADQTTHAMVDKALGFCDQKVREHYAELEKMVAKGQLKWDEDHLDNLVIHYLYARSFFGKMDRPDKVTAYYLGQAEKHWLGKGLYQEGQLALALHRLWNAESAQKIVRSLRERAVIKEELGMYWVFDYGFYFYQMPIETQSLMVEVFDEVAKDSKAVEDLRIWLLKNKQTNRWESTKATALAVYALLLNGDNWLQNSQPVKVTLGGKSFKPQEYEAGTGYFKQQWSGGEVKPSFSELKIENPNSNIAWGAAYWQYFEDLDKITSFKKTPLTIVKQLFREDDSATGKVLSPLTSGANLKRGDKVKVRIEIRVDRPMEYVHLKDMRASGLEPLNVLSGYRWQGGLGYYESTRDLATNFFIDYLPRGTFVFEYPLVVSQKGDFSNGVTTMQCMYAPEFTTHSAGIRLKLD